jgi:hypothetical protein
VRRAPLRSFDELFTPEANVVAELKRRQRDSKLRQSTHAVLRPHASPILKECAEPSAVLFRQIATPTHEILRFLAVTERLALRPLILEYTADKFVNSGNSYKKALGKLPIHQSTGSDGRDIVRYVTIFDFNKYAGKRLSDIKSKWGASLQDFHHDMLKCATGLDPAEVCVDATPWFKEAGGNAARYYDAFMTLFVRDAILFENFHATATERPFVERVVTPAFKKVSDAYGYTPLIARLIPKHEELRPYWDAYPKTITRCLPPAH